MWTPRGVNGGFFGGKVLQKRSDGRWIQISERITEEGGIVAIYTDITDLKNAELELSAALEHLRSTQDHLVQAEKMAALGQLTAGIAHEINSPVGVVANSADSFERCAGKITEAIEESVGGEQQNIAEADFHFSFVVGSRHGLLEQAQRHAVEGQFGDGSVVAAEQPRVRKAGIHEVNRRGILTQGHQRGASEHAVGQKPV